MMMNILVVKTAYLVHCCHFDLVDAMIANYSSLKYYADSGKDKYLKNMV
jgi:hypothetical protein